MKPVLHRLTKIFRHGIAAYCCFLLSLTAGCVERVYVQLSNAMAPTIKAGDRVIIDPAAYKERAPARWDVILFSHPEARGSDSKSLMRVVGLPGEVIQLQGDDILLGGRQLLAPPLLENIRYRTVSVSSPSTSKKGHARPVYPLTIPENCYFVLGDNCLESYDSRFWGVLRRDDILGKGL